MLEERIKCSGPGLCRALEKFGLYQEFADGFLQPGCLSCVSKHQPDDLGRRRKKVTTSKDSKGSTSLVYAWTGCRLCRQVLDVNAAVWLWAGADSIRAKAELKLQVSLLG